MSAHLSDGSLGSNIITFKLCVKDGKLEGFVQQGGAFLLGKIVSQNVISENEVEFTAESKDGKTAKIKLKLTGERQFIGTFADGHTFEGRKLNSNRGCLEPLGSMGRPGGETSSSGGRPVHPPMGGPGGFMGGEPTSSGGQTSTSGGTSSSTGGPHPPTMTPGFMGGHPTTTTSQAT